MVPAEDGLDVFHNLAGLCDMDRQGYRRRTEVKLDGKRTPIAFLVACAHRYSPSCDPKTPWPVLPTVLGHGIHPCR